MFKLKILFTIFLYFFSLFLMADSTLQEPKLMDSNIYNIEQYELELAKLKSEKRDLTKLLKREKYTNSTNKKKSRSNKRKSYNRNRNMLYIYVDISQQSMRVYQGNRRIYHWRVSTGRRGFGTPRGNFRPKFIRKRYRSDVCHGQFMMNAIVLNNKLAIYGSNSTWKLGQNVSYGCVRISKDNSKKLYKLVQSYGKYRVRVKITR